MIHPVYIQFFEILGPGEVSSTGLLIFNNPSETIYKTGQISARPSVQYHSLTHSLVDLP